MGKIKFNYLKNGDPKVCETILRSLPDWFGIEESTKAYIVESSKLPMIIGYDKEVPVAFVNIKNHGIHTSEIYVMGILPEFHRQKIGFQILNEVEKRMAFQGVSFLQVKTLAQDRECRFYNKTRLFYKSYGFLEVEVFPTLWGEANPCQLLIKSIPKIEDELEKVFISSYNQKWKTQFEKMKSKLQECLGNLAISIDHIGSTSVENLEAKDRIDVQITVNEISDKLKMELDLNLERHGFLKSKYYKDHRPIDDYSNENEWEKLYISGKHPDFNFLSNIHVRVLGRENQKYPLLFRDYLRNHKEMAIIYEKCKKELSRFHPYDRIAYSDIKDPICDLIMVQAKKWSQKINWTVKQSMEK